MIIVMSVDLRFIQSKISTEDTFRICALGEIEVDDIENFFKVLKAALNHYNVTLPMS